jgi:hypothetical protein
MSVLALFVALGGSAYALKKNSVASKQLKDNGVKNVDLANDAVTSQKVADGSLLADDFGAGQLPQGPQGSQGPQGPAGSPDTPQQVLDKLKQVDGAGSGLEADSVAGFAASDLGTVGRSAEGVNCLDDNQTSTACASVDLTMPRAGRVLVIGDGFAVASTLDDGAGPGFTTDAIDLVQGTCTLNVDNVSLTRSSSQSMFNANATDGFSISTVTASLPSGTHTFSLRCLEEDGDIDWGRSRITAVMLGSS